MVLSYKNDNINFPKTIFEAVEGEVTLEVGERVKSFIVKVQLMFNVYILANL